MATYNISITVPAAKDEKLQRVFARVNKKRVDNEQAEWATIEDWWSDHIWNWAIGLWGAAVEAESEEVKEAYSSLSKTDQNAIRTLAGLPTI